MLRRIIGASTNVGSFGDGIPNLYGFPRHWPPRFLTARAPAAEGREPRWSADGRELYYLSGLTGKHALKAVSIDTTTPELRVGKSQRLFEFSSRPFVPQANIFQYDVGSEQRRFLVNVLTSDDQPTLNVITNWQALVK